VCVCVLLMTVHLKTPKLCGDHSMCIYGCTLSECALPFQMKCQVYA
jgi:hypothetical protein